MNISEADASDLPSIFEIEICSTLDGWSKRNIADSYNCGNLFYKLVKAECLIGYCILSLMENYVEILNLTIAKKSQNRGLGYYFLSELFKQQRFISVSRVWLEVRESNHVALALYKKIGFAKTGIRKNYYKNGNKLEDAVLMQLKITQEERRPTISC